MRRSGDLVLWNDDRGFGFVRDSDGKRHFVHISAIRRAEARPQPGDRVTFDPSVGPDGRPVARSVVLMGVAPVARPAKVAATQRHVTSSVPGTVSRVVAAVALILEALFVALLRPAASWVLVAYLVLGIVSIGLYWIDKSAAEAGAWRISEKSLHLSDLAGGIAGGLLAQALLRHKVRKPGFAAVTWFVTALHTGGLGALAIGLWHQSSWL